MQRHYQQNSPNYSYGDKKEPGVLLEETLRKTPFFNTTRGRGEEQEHTRIPKEDEPVVFRELESQIGGRKEGKEELQRERVSNSNGFRAEEGRKR